MATKQRSEWPVVVGLQMSVPQQILYETVYLGHGASGGVFDIGTTVSASAAAHPLFDQMREQVREFDALARASVAHSFTERVREDGRVREVWFADAEYDAAITVIVSEASLEDELHFEAVLASVLEFSERPFNGFLRIYSEAEGVPDFAREGTPLLLK